MNVVDSSAWIEYFNGGSNAAHFAAPIEKTSALLVPAVTLLEVSKWIARARGKDAALRHVTVMMQGEVVALDAELALQAAAAGLEHKLPTADSIVYATAQSRGATVWTQDADFKGLPNVKYWPK